METTSLSFQKRTTLEAGKKGFTVATTETCAYELIISQCYQKLIYELRTGIFNKLAICDLYIYQAARI